MNRNTFGKTKAANDLVTILRKEGVDEGVIRTIGKKISNYNRGLNSIIRIGDGKIKNQLLNIWKEQSLNELAGLQVSDNVYNHLKNIEIAYLRRKRDSVA